MFKSHLYSTRNRDGKPTWRARIAAFWGVIRHPSALVAALKDQKTSNARSCNRSLQQSIANALNGCI